MMNKSAQLVQRGARRNFRGFTLVELMVALLLGLLLIAGVISVFLANKQSYRTNAALSDLQGNARLAFEMLTRDVRQAGSTPCGNTITQFDEANATTSWWGDWANPIMGVDDTSSLTADLTSNPKADSGIRLLGTQGDSNAVDLAAAVTTGKIAVVGTPTGFAAGRLAVICNMNGAALFKVTGTTNNSVSFNSTYDADISSYTDNATQVVPYTAHYWYIGHNPNAPANVDSLYRQTFAGAEEMLRGVRSMQISYLVSGANSYVNAATVGAVNWPNVQAVRVTLTLDQPTNPANNTHPEDLVRSFTTTISRR